MYVKLKIAFCLLPLFFVLSCSEQQIFDNTFKLSLKQTFLEYCQSGDLYCQDDVNQQFDKCFKQGDFDTEKLYQTTQKSMNESEAKTFIKFGKSLQDCMANSMGGDYAKNIRNGFEKNVKITRSTVPQNTTSGLLIAIKSNGDIWINKDKVKIKDFKSMVKDLAIMNPDLNAVIIPDKNSSTADLVSVMDQLKSAGIEKISISTKKQ